jgi:hypothetical protein
VQAPGGGLFGSASLVNVKEGTDYSYNAVALADWRNAPLWSAPDGAKPDLDDVTPKISTVVYRGNGEDQIVVTGSEASWGGTNAVDPVTAVLMHEYIANEFVLDQTIKAHTDLVMTFPTKRFYYTWNPDGTAFPTDIFQRMFASNGACETIDAVSGCHDYVDPLIDREEFRVTKVCFNEEPPPSPYDARYACSSASVLGFNFIGTSPVLKSLNNSSMPAYFSAGWWIPRFWPINASSQHQPTPPYGRPARILTSSGVPTHLFTPRTNTLASFSSANYFGLPVIGMSVVSFTKDVLGARVSIQPAISNYGALYAHKYTRKISLPAQ